MDFVNNGLVY